MVWESYVFVHSSEEDIQLEKKKKKDLNFSRKDNYKSKGKLDFIIQHWPTAPEKQPWKADTL